MNNSNDKVKNDFLFFQNEILTDVKKVETRINEKISQTTDFIDQQNQKIENKFKDINSRFESLSNQMQEKDSSHKFEALLQQIKHKIDESISKIEIKLNLLDRDLNDACFKYDKVISNNLKVPGLIGSSCPYDSLKPFLEFINRKLSELLKSKDKQTLDLKKYKEKMETIIGQNKTQFDTVQNKFNEYCTNLFKQSDVNCTDRISVIEKRIEALRMENGKYAYDLQERSKELKIEWDKLDEFEKNMNKRYSEEVEKYNILIDGISRKVDKGKQEFHLIKARFTELSEFIKDVRFRRNIHNTFKERKEYRDISTKIDFTKKQKLKAGEIAENEDNKDKEKESSKDILAPFDYYAHFGLERDVQEEDEYYYEDSPDNSNNNRNNLISSNKISDTKNKDTKNNSENKNKKDNSENFNIKINNENNNIKINKENNNFKINSENNNIKNNSINNSNSKMSDSKYSCNIKSIFNNIANNINNNETSSFEFKDNNKNLKQNFLEKNSFKKPMENEIKNINIERKKERYKTQKYLTSIIKSKTFSDTNTKKSVKYYNIEFNGGINDFDDNQNNDFNINQNNDAIINKNNDSNIKQNNLKVKSIENNINEYKIIPKKDIKPINIKPKINEVDKSDENKNKEVKKNNNQNIINKSANNNIKIDANKKEINKIIQENNQKNTKKTIKYEPAKINDLILHTNFKNNNLNNSNTSSQNLNQTYMLLKKRTEEMQKIKMIYGGKMDKNSRQVSPSPPLRNKSSKNSTRNFKNYNLNQNNIFSKNDFKKGNKEDLYYSKLMRDKLNQASAPNIKSVSQEHINPNNTIDKRMFPRIYKNNEKMFKSTSNEINSMFSTYINDVNKQFLNDGDNC